MYPSPYEKRIERENKWMFWVSVILVVLSLTFFVYHIANAKSINDLKFKIVPVVTCEDYIAPDGYELSGCYDDKTTTITLIEGYSLNILIHELGHFYTIHTNVRTLKKVFKLPTNTSWFDTQEYAADRFVDYILNKEILSQAEVDFYQKQIILFNK
jgi:hypothetical protein